VIKKEWIPNMDFIYYKTNIFKESNWYEYWISMYHSIMLFGVNEMAPETELEIGVSTVVMLVSALVNASMFG